MRIQAQAIAASPLGRDMRASADYLGNGSIETNRYETEILDIVRRTSSTYQRTKDMGCWVPATGHPHRYFEQTGIATANATDPRNIAPTASGPARQERAAMIKAVVAQSNFSHFDVEVTQQQGQFAQVEAKDISDIISADVVKIASMLWMGSDTSLVAPTTLEWVGAIQQIVTGGNIASCNPGTSIIDVIKTEVATLMSSTLYDPRPSAVYLNPLLADLIDQEAKAANYKFNLTTFIAGEQVSGLQTQAGVLPLVGDQYLTTLSSAQLSALGLPAIPAGATKCYPCVILQENMLEVPYVNPNGGPDPRIFQLGLLSGLQGQFVGICYNSLIVKAAAYAHALVLVYR